MCEKDERRKLAAAVWVRTGRPAVSVVNMTDEEVERLIALEESEGFAAEMREFVNKYLDSRKATEDETKVAEETETVSVQESDEQE